MIGALKGLRRRHLRDPQCGQLSGEQPVIVHRLCCYSVISLFSPLCQLGGRHKGCVKHPNAICFNKMAQFVYTLITEAWQQDQI